MPCDKKAKAITTINGILNKTKITLKELQSVIGLLNFACKVVVPGRAFLRRLINLTIGMSKPHHHIRLNSDAKADLQAWLLFLRLFNGKTFFLPDQWLSADALHLYTDAAGSLGYGAILDKEWFYGKWPESWVSESITLKEFFPILAAVMVWSKSLADTRIIIHTDNLALVHVINSKTSKEVKVMSLVRKFVVHCMLFNIEFKAQHVPGYENTLADKLSRLQVHTFKALAPWARDQPILLPDALQPQNCFLG